MKRGKICPAYYLNYVKTNILHMQKQRRRFSFAVTVKLIGAFVSATQIVKFLFFQNFQPLAFFCACTARFVYELLGNHFVCFLVTRLSMAVMAERVVIDGRSALVYILTAST